MLKEKRTIVLYVILAILAIGVIAIKRDYHLDEYYSYGLANHIGTYRIVVEDGMTYEPSIVPFLDDYAANPNDRFNYGNVWQNQSWDVHPPLYYALLHTVCSFFPGTFSKWYAGIINVLFVLLTFYIYRKLLKLYTDDENIYRLASCVFVFSAGIIFGVGFLRMYVMAMFLVTSIAYHFAKVIITDSMDWKWYVLSLIIAIAGALTHYYCVLYLVISCMVLGVWLLSKKKWKNLLAFCITMGIAAGTSIVVFPAMLNHVFSGYRGTESIENLSAFSWEDSWNRIKYFWVLINNQVMGGLLPYIIVFLCIFCFLSCKTILCGHRDGHTSMFKWGMLIVPVAAYFLLISKMAIYLTDRYIYPIYALALFVVVVGVYKTVCILINGQKSREIVMCLFCVVLVVNAWSRTNYPNLYLEQVDRLETVKKYAGINAIVVRDDSMWKLHTMYQDVLSLKSSTFVHGNNIYLLGQYKYKNDKEFILLSVWDDQQAALNEVMTRLPYVNKYEILGSFGYYKIYRLYSDGESCDIQAQDGSIKFEDVYLMSTDEGYVNILVDGQALDVEHAVFVDGTKVSLYPFNGTTAQKWKIVDAGDGNSYIESSNQEYCLVHDESGNLSIATKNVNVIGQKWNIVY